MSTSPDASKPAQNVAPRVPKGFHDFTPNRQTIRQRCIAALHDVFNSFGFMPIDTPVLEYADVLLGAKDSTHGGVAASETEKQTYRFIDHGKRDVALRFDLTVPFARFTAVNHNDLPRPFNRYQIGKVFRGENTQKGRYREFYQCDFDIVGVDTPYADCTIVNIITTALTTLTRGAVAPLPHAENSPAYHVHISHRGVVNELLVREQCQAHLVPVLRIMDKLRKIPREALAQELSAYMGEKSANNLLDICTPEATNTETLRKIKTATGESEAYIRLQEIERITQTDDTFGKIARVIIDPGIMRGFDYYTGFVCETFVNGAQHLGSVCSGGRYNDLTQRFGVADMKGVGASIGLDRLLAVTEEITNTTSAPTYQSPHNHTVLYGQTELCLTDAFARARALRTNGISAEVFPQHYPSPQEFARGLKRVFKYTDKIAARFLIILGEAEHNTNTVTIKNLISREQRETITIEQATQWIQQTPTH